MPRPIQAFIHADALAHNLRCMRSAAPDANVWAVVKANAYGHGIERVFDSLRGADGFALLDFAEAERLRRLGWRGPVLMLEGCFDARDIETCARLDLWHIVHRDEQLDWLAAAKLARPQQIFLKLNSGMNRLGFTPTAYRSAWQRANAMPQIDRVTHATHFANADNAAGVADQHAVFERATHDLAGQRSLSNSAVLLRHPELAQRDDWVRPGIALYGGAPDHPLNDAAHWNLQPAMSLRSRIIAVQQLQAGDSVGYGAAFTTRAPLRIGVVACGYADGYPRHAPSGTPVLVGGTRTRTVGRVSMDMITVDLGAVASARVGTEVTLWGRSSTDAAGATLPIDEVAHAAGTVGYELMCALAPRVPVSLA
jgi:alanine racemase